MSTRAERPDGASVFDRYGWIAVVAAGLLAYHNCFDGQQYIDDFRVLPGAPQHEPQMDALVPNLMGNRWLGVWSFAAGAAAFGTSLSAVHGVNLAIHLLAAVALWGFVARTLRLPRFENRFQNRAGPLATVIAGLWVVHPLTTAAVTYMCQRFESQMGMFVLVSSWAVARAATASTGRIWWYGLSVGAAGAATASKEPAVVLPFVLLIYDRLFVAGSWRGVVRRWPLFVALLAAQASVLPIALATLAPLLKAAPVTAAATVPVVTAPPAPPGRADEPLLLSGLDGLYRNETEMETAGFQASGVTPWMYLRTQPEVILHYLRLVVVPEPLILDYNWPVATDPGHIWPPGLVILALLGGTGWTVARGTAGGFLGVWFFAFLAVSSSIVPIIDLAFEHRMYLPLAACVAALVLGADRVLNRVAEHLARHPGGVKGAAALAAGAVLVVLTVSRNEDYRDIVRMNRQLVERVPDNGRAWNNLGTECARQKRFAEAGEAFRTALRHSDQRAPGLRKWTWCNLIQLTLESIGPSTELVEVLSAFAADDPENPSRRFLLANARFDIGDRAGAVADYRAAIELANRKGIALREPEVFGNYAQALMDSGNFEAALPEYDRAMACDTPPPKLRVQYGQILARLHRDREGRDLYPKAESLFRAASEQAPRIALGPYNLGVLRLHQGNPADAENGFQEALRRDPKYVWARLGLAQALHESGHADAARQRFAEVRRLWPDWPRAVADRAWPMATHPEPGPRYAAEALRLARLFEEGCEENERPAAFDLKAAALAEAGQFPDAERAAKRAVDLAREPGSPYAGLADEYEARRKLYAQGQPFREPARPSGTGKK